MTANIRYRLTVLMTTIMCLLFFMSTMVFAAEPGKVDKSQAGSLNIKFVDTDAKPITGGNIEIFYVASIEDDSDGNDTYVLNKGFSELVIDYNDFGSAEFALEAFNATKKNGLTGTIKDVDSNGHSYFDNLPVGMYLITQPKANEGYYAINPYIATIPFNDNGQWIYDIDSIPKMEPYCEEITPEPTASITPTETTTPTVIVTVTPEVTVTTTPEVPITTTPEVTVTITPEVTVTITPEVTTPPEPTVTVVPPVITTTPEVTVTTTPVPTVTVTPTATPTPTPSSSMIGGGGTRIPQTGKLNWPIPVLSFIGAALVLTGWTIKRFDDDSYER